jgi:uncharacterized protein YndB with AHSA1/START domain
MDELVVERSIDLDAGAAELWRMVSDADELAGWFAPEVDLVVEPGAQGRIVDDDGVARTAQVDTVESGRRVVFRWWPEEGDDGASVVSLTVVDRPGGARLVVTERRVGAVSEAVAKPVARAVADAWAWRFDLLWLRLTAAARV